MQTHFMGSSLSGGGCAEITGFFDEADGITKAIAAGIVLLLPRLLFGSAVLVLILIMFLRRLFNGRGIVATLNKPKMKELMESLLCYHCSSGFVKSTICQLIP